MSEGAKDGRGLISVFLHYCPSALNLLRLLLICLILGIAVYWTYFHLAQKRTVVVDAKTGALEIELTSELSGKTFRSFYVCQRGARDDNARQDLPPAPINCPRTYQRYGPFEAETPRLPIGTKLKLTSLPRSLRIDVESIPKDYLASDRREDTDLANMVGGAYILAGTESIGAFGTLTLQGVFQLGAGDEETGRVSIIEGRYQIRGFTLAGLVGDDMRELRGGTLQAGALLRFVDSDDKTTRGALAIIMDNPDDTLMRVTAISNHATNNLAVRYYFTDETVLRPSFLEAVILDPLFQLMASIFGMIAGYGWLRRVFLI